MDGFENSGLESLGAARPTDAELSRMVALSLGVPRADVTFSTAAPLDFPVANMTTGGLFRVFGRADVGSAVRDFSMIIKIVHSVHRWPLITMVPPDFRDVLSERYDWRTEPDVYRSDVAKRLPEGLRMPHVLAVVDLDQDSAAIWMEQVAEDPSASWDLARFCRAAELLGLFGANPDLADTDASIRSLKPVDGMRFFLEGPARHIFIPALQSEEFWHHPVIDAVTDDQLRRDILGLVDRMDDLVEELCQLPTLPAHGDASPQNLISEGDGFVVIDWGSHGPAPIGFDLAQLLAGRVNEGLLRGAELASLDGPCLEAFVRGLRHHGCLTSAQVVRRGHALAMAIFSSMSALVSDKLEGPDTPALRNLMRGRAEMARFLVDLVRESE